MSAVADQLRRYALGPGGKFNFWWIGDNYMRDAVYAMLEEEESSVDLTFDERRLFLLFVAEAMA